MMDNGTDDPKRIVADGYDTIGARWDSGSRCEPGLTFKVPPLLGGKYHPLTILALASLPL